MEKIILASGSQRRKMLLTQAGIPFEVIPSEYDESEDMNSEVSPYDLVKTISTKKAVAVSENLNEPAIIISGDTVVSITGKIMGKPKTGEEAYKMLSLLQGKTHSVYTGSTIIKKGAEGFELRNIVDTTKVTMRRLTDDEIWSYIRTGEPFDKAGGYAIQERGSLLISSIEGDYYNVVGLPLVKVYGVLTQMGVKLHTMW